MEDTGKADSESIPKTDDASQGKSCALCGCATPAVRCDRCNSQIFCLSCDDMYHRHPKRKFHLRKAVDSIWNSARSPRLRRQTDLPGDPCKIPIPPPRTKKRERHTIGGRIFLKSGLELGSFGHSKVFDANNIMQNSKNFISTQKSPESFVGSNCDDETSKQSIRPDVAQIYENDNMPNEEDSNLGDRSPWNTRPNIASPIQVSIPSSSPDIVSNGQAFGYPAKPQSQSVADLTGHPSHAVGHHPYHFHPPYPYMHPPMHPTYSHSMAHLNCPQCISSSWSNLMSPHASPYFHPMPWGSAQNTMSREHPIPSQTGPLKHSHGDLVSYPDSNFHYPYPGAGYYHNGPPVVDPNFIKDLHEHAELQKLKKRAADAKASPRNEEMDSMDIENVETGVSNVPPSTDDVTSTAQDVQNVEDELAPEKPSEPWSCIHCTYINPPRVYICQVCCKTSYGNKGSKSPEDDIRSMSRDSGSPLVNRDALLNTPDISGFKEQKEDEVMEHIPSEISEANAKLTTETQTLTTTKSTDVQTQNIHLKSMASSTDSIFPKQEMSVQTEVEATAQNCSVATDPMISSQSMESLLSGVSAPPYHNRRAGWGRGATSFSTQSLYERGRSRSPMPRSASMYNDAHNTLAKDSNFQSDEAMHSLSQAWLFSDPMYYKPHNQGLEQTLSKEDYFDGTWGSMDKLNRRVQHKRDKGKLENKPKFHRSLDDLKGDKRHEIVHHQELLLLQTVKEAERCGFSLEDLHVAYLHCGKENPVYWLEDNWSSMVKNVIALAAKYGEENEENDVGVITSTEAKDALRIHRGDIWDAVTECIENRQRKILELTVRGNFTQKQISDTLKNNEGNIELAYADLLRASTRRHKFILSPGLSEDSEVDLNIYNPTEDTSVDRNVNLSPMKAAKQDISIESKMEKKKSDFLTKLSSIRQAQSERRKAREEKELIRESITSDLPDTNVVILKEKEDISEEVQPVITEDSEKLNKTLVAEKVTPVTIVDTDSKDENISNGDKNVKEGTDDNIPVDFDANWEDSQGHWIEEYDEHWDEEADSQWVGLGKKMEKEFEEEAMQMAALWEKEELEDDVFEEETKDIKPKAAPDTQKKFDAWVKANLTKVDSSEYEEEDLKGKILEDTATASLPDSELEVTGPSPLHHYPTEYDLSKSQLDSDWVNLPADEEIEKLTHDIVCEGSDIENKFDENMISYEQEKKLRKSSDQYSDEDWEKIDLDEQLQDVNELDHFTFLDKDESEVDVDTYLERITNGKDQESSFAPDIASHVTIDQNSNVTYKNINLSTTNDFGESDITDSLQEVMSPREKLLSSDGDQPKPPVRRKSKLNSAAIEQALINQAMIENKSVSDDIPPALPEKAKSMESEQKVVDIYSVSDKTSKLDQQESEKTESSIPQKPPRLSLSPQSTLQRGQAIDKELEVAVKAASSKDASPVTSLSNESDSNCFADSESDSEVKRHRHKNIHRKLVKYENELDELEGEILSKTKLEKEILEEKSDLKLQMNMEFEDDLDLEPLPSMKDIDYDPELPITLAGRGSRINELDDVSSPKAFREDTARPLQLFKAIKRESPASPFTLSSSVFVETDSKTCVESLSDVSLQPVSGTFVESFPESDNKFNSDPVETLEQSVHYENQVSDKYYYNETVSPQNENQFPNKIQTYDNEIIFQQSVSQNQLQEDQNLEKLQSKQVLVPDEEIIEEFAQSPSPIEEDEMAFTEMEGISAAVDYFFGRYNEITVTRPKKKMPVRPKPLSSTNIKSAPPPDTLSTSVTSVPKSEVTIQMDQNVSSALESKSLESVPISSVQNASSIQQLQKSQPTPSTTVSNINTSLIENKAKEPAVDEYLPFAEDYLFGCYNQVVIPKKPKKKPVPLAPIPKMGSPTLTRTSHFLKEEKLVIPRSVCPEIPQKMPVEEMPKESVEENISSDIVSVDTSTYDDVFHDLPSEMLSNQSFDDGGSIYYESFQDAVEDIQVASSVNDNIVNVRAKTVHFEEPKTPVVPPRRNKGQNIQKTTASISTADEYLFKQYEESSLSKKKLPVCSEDFKMNQGLEPTEFPCDTPLQSNEEYESVLPSEISVEIPTKATETSKNVSEYDFRDSEQPLDFVKYEEDKSSFVNEITSSKAYQDNISNSKDNSFSDILSPGSISENISGNIIQDSVSQTSDIQVSKSTVAIEKLPIFKSFEEGQDGSFVCNTFDISERHTIVSDNLSGNLTKSVINNEMKTARTQDMCSYKEDSSSFPLEAHEINQFVFIDENRDIIDDSYTMYDIQETLESSIGSELNYVGIKNNTEDECADDSEQEWKRNEDIKNTLNASFIAPVSIETFSDDQTKSIIDEATKYLDESKNLLLGNESRIKESSFEENQEKCEQDKVLESLEASFVSLEENKNINLEQKFSVVSSDIEQSESIQTCKQDFEIAEHLYTSSKCPNQLENVNLDQIMTVTEHDVEPLTKLPECVEDIPVELKDTFSDESKVIQDTISIENIEEINTNEELTESSQHKCQKLNELFIPSLSSLCQTVAEGLNTIAMNIPNYSSFKYEDTTFVEDSNVMSEEQPIDILEDLEASFELSDNADDLSDDVSVSTQIAISTKLNMKEYDTDDSSFILQSNKMLDDNEEYVIDALSKPVGDEQSAIVSDDIETFVVISENNETLFDFSSKVEEQEQKTHLESLNISDNEKSMIAYEKLPPTPTVGIMPSAILDTYDSEIGTEEPRKFPSSVESLEEKSCSIYFELCKDSSNELEKPLFLKSISNDIVEETSTRVLKEESEQQDIEHTLQSSLVESDIGKCVPEQVDYFITSKSKTLSYEDNDHSKQFTNLDDFLDTKQEYLCNEDKLQEKSEIDYYDTETRGPKGNDFSSDSMVSVEEIEEITTEEEFLPIMSHFYDEWYQIDKPSAQFTLLSIDSAYAKYGAKESSESGNDSDVDNVQEIVTSKDIQEHKVYDAEESLDMQKEFIEKSKMEYLSTESKDEFIDEFEVNCLIDVNHKADTVFDTFIEDKNMHSIVQAQHLEIESEIIENNKETTEKNLIFEDITSRSEFLSQFQENTETVAVTEIDSGSVQNNKTSEVRYIESKFSTSKSCQTEDSFEEDIFFDSFDDAFTIPSHLHFPIEDRAKPPTSEISIQCELINIENILSSGKNLSSVTQKQQVALKVEVDDVLPGHSKESDIDDMKSKQNELNEDKEREESSCESFEDSDSDLFIESHSSHDELDVSSNKRSLLYAEIDSDTGFSSGSECGWIKKTDINKKAFAKNKKSYEVTVLEGTEIVSECNSQKVLASKQISGQVIGESSVIQDQLDEDKIIEKINVIEESIKQIKQEKSKEVSDYSEFISEDDKAPFPSDIIERAVTPVAIPQYPSFEDDLIFVEVEESTEVTENSKEGEEAVCTTPTVEYFYGPLPHTVEIEKPPDINERFFETTSDLPETMSVSESSSAMGDVSSIDQILTEDMDDGSFVETLSSMKNEADNDSISEYYSLSDSSVLLSARQSIAENDNFSLAFNEFIDISTQDLTASSSVVIKASDINENIITFLEGNLQEDLLSDEKSKKDKIFQVTLLEENINDTDMSCRLVERLDSYHESVISNNLTQNIISNSVIHESIDSFDTSDKTKCDDKSSSQKTSVSSDEILHVNLSKSSTVCATSENICNEVSDNFLTLNSSIISTNELNLSEDFKSLKISAPENANEYTVNKSDPVCAVSKLSEDASSVPSDIVRYLYYDDSITFDDESFHTQSENFQIPELPTDEMHPIVSDQDVVIHNTKKECGIFTESINSVNDFSTGIMVQANKVIENNLLFEPSQISIVESPLSELSFVKSDELVVQNVEPENLLTTVKQNASEEFSSCISTEADLETASPEDFNSKNKTDHPAYELPNETLQTIYENMQELAASADILDNVLTYPKDDSQDVVEVPEIRQTSPDVPKVPSDVVKYLYYDDEITFDENSFHTQSDKFEPSIESPLEAFRMDISDQDLDVKAAVAVTSKPPEEEVIPIAIPQISIQSQKKLSLDAEHIELFVDISSKTASSVPDSSSIKDVSAVDNSESIDKWFDFEEDKSVPSLNSRRRKSLDSEHFSTTKSSVLKDSEEPCIPEIVLSPKLESNVSNAKIDVDEVTDISTHFTMTDDSDRFSDIECDTSLNFEEECIFPDEAADVAKENKADLDKLDIATPDLIVPEDILIVDLPKLSSKQSVMHIVLESQIQEKFSEHLSNEEQLATAECFKFPTVTHALEHSESFEECIDSNEYKHILKEEFIKDSVATDALEYSEIFEECFTSSEFKQSAKDESVKKLVLTDTSKNLKVFDEYATSNDFVESPKEKNIEDSIHTNTFEHSEIYDEYITSHEFKQSAKDEPVKELVLTDTLKHLEIFDECAISDDFIELPKEKNMEDSIHTDTFEHSEIYDECITSHEFKQSAKDEPVKELVLTDTLKHLEVFDECATSGDFIESPKEKNIEDSIHTDTFEHSEIYDECTTSHEFKQSVKDEPVKELVLADTLKHLEVFVECATSDDFIESSKEKNMEDSIHTDTFEQSEIYDECSTSHEFKQLLKGECVIDSASTDKLENSDIFVECATSNEYSEQCKKQLTQLTLKTDEQQIDVDLTKHFQLELKDQILESTVSNDILSMKDVNGNFTNLTVDEIISPKMQSVNTDNFSISSENKETCSSCMEMIASESIANSKDVIDSSIDFICHISPHEKSQNVSDVLNESWSDAESRQVEVDESVYDLPLECSSNNEKPKCDFVSETSHENEFIHDSRLSDITKGQFEIISSEVACVSDKNYFKIKEEISDEVMPISSFVECKEVETTIETVYEDAHSDNINVIDSLEIGKFIIDENNEDISDVSLENKKTEASFKIIFQIDKDTKASTDITKSKNISENYKSDTIVVDKDNVTADDQFMAVAGEDKSETLTTCQSSKINKSTSSDNHSLISGLIKVCTDSIKSGISYLLDSSELNSNVSTEVTDSLLLPDLENISEIKMECESEISTTSKENIINESVSTTVGVQPNFSLNRTMYDAQEVESGEIAGKDHWVEENVLADIERDLSVYHQSGEHLETSDIDITMDAKYFDSEPVPEILSVKDEKKDPVEYCSQDYAPKEVLFEDPFRQNQLITDKEKSDVRQEVSGKAEESVGFINSLTEDKINLVKDPYTSVSEDSTLKFIEHDKLCVNNNMSFEIVDFKGEFIVNDVVDLSQDFSFVKDNNILKNTPSENIVKLEKSNQPLEVVDFKGHLVKEDNISQLKSEENKFINGIGSTKCSIKENIFDIYDSSLFQTVDFKGKVLCDSGIIEHKTEKVDISVKDSMLAQKQLHYGEESPFEVVDFKGVLTTGELPFETNIISSNIHATTGLRKVNNEGSIIKREEDVDIVDFRGNICSDYFISEVQKESCTPEIVDSSLVPNNDSTFKQEIISVDNIVKADGTYEQVNKFEPEKNVSFKAVDSCSYSVYEESSELYSCVETLPASEDNSLQFCLLSDDTDDTLNTTTSDEFTDVQSHLTSTEESDKWSDVEAEFSFEDSEFDRDKTPVRSLQDDIIYENEKDIKNVTCESAKIDSVIKDIEIEACARVTIKDLEAVIKPKSDHMNVEIKQSENKVYVAEMPMKTEIISEPNLNEVISSLEIIQNLSHKSEKFEAAVPLSIDEKESRTMNILEKINDTFNDTENLKVVNEQRDFPAIKTEIGIRKLEASPDSLLESAVEKDHSTITSSDDFTDLTSYHLSSEDSEKFSDFESEMYTAEISEDGLKKFDIISDTNAPNQVAITDNILTKTGEDLVQKNVYEQLDICADVTLMEHFADIKSLNEPLTVVDTFSLVDAETAVSKMHDISPQLEKTESDNWLEADTDHSVSEFEEDFVASIEKDESSEVLDTHSKKSVDGIDIALMSSQQCTDLAYASTTSTSSMYTDLEHSDKVSDTYADISLQGAITDNSDKWSDIEAEVLIDDALYSNVLENLEIPDFSQPLKKSEKENSSGNEIKITESKIPITVEISSEILEQKTKTDSFQAVQNSPVTISEVLQSAQSSSFEGPDSSSVNLTDSGQITVPTESSTSSLLSTPNNVAIGLSDDELTNVTPLDISNESDKFSDISGDTSVEELEEDTSVSLKADNKLLEKTVSDVMQSEFKPDISEKVDTNLIKDEIQKEKQVNDKIDVIELSIPANSSSKEPISKNNENKEVIDSLISKIASQKLCAEENNSSIVKICSKEETYDFSLDVDQKGKVIEELRQTEIYEGIIPKNEEETSVLITKELIDEISSIKPTDEESETFDSYTDVRSHTVTSETSEMYCDLEGDQSVEDFEVEYLHDGELVSHENEQDIVDSRDVLNYREESFLSPEEFVENADEYALDIIPGNELENYDEEYSLSEHFEINEDELIYPLPYNDWIEQSFDLKEYGVEAVFSDTGSEIHGYDIANDEYDDEDIQRAIDFNISNFEDEDVENVMTTESFKTISNDTSPHLKVSDKEYDTWSTADAPSIEEDFGEHDDVLSKIDELLAEDFGDLDSYQAESPMKLDFNEQKNYFMKDVSSPVSFESEINNKKLIEKDILVKDTLLQTGENSEINKSGYILDQACILEESSQVYEEKLKTFIGTETVEQLCPTELGRIITSKAEIPASISDQSKTLVTEDKKIVSCQEETSISLCSAEIKDRDNKNIVLSSEETVISLSPSDKYDNNVESRQGISLKDEKNSSIEVETSSKHSIKSSVIEHIESVLSSHDETSVAISKENKKSPLKQEICIKRRISADENENIELLSDDMSKSFVMQKAEKEVSSKSENIFESSKDFQTCEDISTSFILSKEKEDTSSESEKNISSRIIVDKKDVLSSDETSASFVLPKAKEERFSAECSIKSDISVQYKDFQPLPDEISATVTLPSCSSDIPEQIYNSSDTESSIHIPIMKQDETSADASVNIVEENEITKLTKKTDLVQNSQQFEEFFTVSESSDLKSNIPEQKTDKCSLSMTTKLTENEAHPVTLKNQLFTESDAVEIKPDIPKKTKRKSLDLKEETLKIEESLKKPALPPKKRHSISESPSSSIGGSLSSSLESLGSFESAISDKSSKSSSLKTADEPSVHSSSPDVPARRSRSSRLSSSTKSTDSNASSASSTSMRIRRKSSNFKEPDSIDLSKKRASIDERMLKLQNEGKCANKEKAFIAAKLIEMQFEEEDALMASRQCNSVYHAVKFLTQLCELCNCRFPINLMASMVHCIHRACKECLKAHFTSLIYDRSVFALLCPVCYKPDITDQNIQDYFNHLDMMLRNILEDSVYDLFQRKLRDEVLTKDPNFHWCSQCSSGFIASPRLKKLYCPDCSAITCAMCNQTWELEHEGVHCERFQQWKDMHTPEPPPAGLVKFLVDRGISCPSCGLVYAQACGGCMMYKCSHCYFEFCGFCSRPVKRGKDCSSSNCESLRLHIHHLHNCLFYMRDKDISEIQVLLEEESVTYLTIPPKDQIVKSRCQVREQKHIHGTITEDRCGRDIVPYCGGLCRTHYYEYLAELLRQNNISPLTIMTIQDLQFMLRKSRNLVPEKMKGETSENYYDRLLKLVTSTLT